MIFVIFFPLKDVYGMSAHSAVVIDAYTGRILYEKNANQKMGMASTTKIMTAVVALENSNPGEIVTVSYNADNTEGSSMYLNAGEKIRMESLLYGLMLSSGNDAATAIAEHISKTTDEFAVLMNKKAAEIGMKDSSFANPHGLDNENHYSTAYDMALLAKYAMKNTAFREIVSCKNKSVELNGKENSRYLKNHNKLLTIYPYCIGIKTGFTKKCGRCLVTAAEKDDTRLIAVTLNAPDDWNDHMEMYNNAFSDYSTYSIIQKNDYICSVGVKGARADSLALYSKKKIDLSLKAEEYEGVTLKYSVPESVDAPVYKGQQIGSISVVSDGRVLASAPLISQYGIEKEVNTSYKDNYIYILTDLLSLFFKNI